MNATGRADLAFTRERLPGVLKPRKDSLIERVAASVVAVPATLVKTARNRWPLRAAVAVTCSVPVAALGMLLQVCPPSVEVCHCAVGPGTPEAAAVNVT